MSARHRKLNMEQMERRELMAGDIAGYVSNNTLTLFESSSQAGRDNSVLISQISPGTIRVRGNMTADGTATKINGAAFVDFKVTGGLKVTFGGGNDEVVFSPIAPPSFQNVTLDLAAPVQTRTTLTAKSLAPFTPPDKDKVVLNGAIIPGQLTINTGADDDLVMVIDTVVGKANLKSGSPNTGGITVNTGLGNDTIYFNGLSSNHDINIDAGAGHDKVEMLNGAVIDKFMAELGDGDDLLTINSVNTRLQGTGKTRFSGGNGTDRLTMSGSPFRGLEKTGWEYINGMPVFTPVANPASTGVLTMS